MYVLFYMRGVFPLSLISKTWNKILVLKKKVESSPSLACYSDVSSSFPWMMDWGTVFLLLELHFPSIVSQWIIPCTKALHGIPSAASVFVSGLSSPCHHFSDEVNFPQFSFSFLLFAFTSFRRKWLQSQWLAPWKLSAESSAGWT